MLNMLKHVKCAVAAPSHSVRAPDLLTDQEIVELFLARVRGLNQEEAAARVSEVKQHDMSRWRRGEFKRLSERKRQALLDYLGEIEERPEDGGPGEDLDPPADRIDAEEFFRFGRTMLTQMDRDGVPQLRKRGAWMGLQTTLVNVLGRVPQWWWDEYERLGGRDG